MINGDQNSSIDSLKTQYNFLLQQNRQVLNKKMMGIFKSIFPRCGGYRDSDKDTVTIQVV